MHIFYRKSVTGFARNGTRLLSSVQKGFQEMRRQFGRFFIFSLIMTILVAEIRSLWEINLLSMVVSVTSSSYWCLLVLFVFISSEWHSAPANARNAWSTDKRAALLPARPLLHIGRHRMARPRPYEHEREREQWYPNNKKNIVEVIVFINWRTEDN